MNSKKVLFTILAGTALSTIIGVLLNPYKDSSRRKKIVEKAKDYTDLAGETIKKSVDKSKNQLKKMDEDTDRMVNEGGKVV